MKRLIAMTVLVGLGLLQPWNGRADDLFQLFWRGTYYTTDGNGHIIAVQFSEADLVNQVAQNDNLDPSTLVLVFRPNERDAAVVRTSNGQFIASVMQFSSQGSAQSYTDIVNPNGTVIVRHSLLSDQSHPIPLGSFFGLELPTRNANGSLQNDSLVGTVLYGKPDSDTVYGAQVSTGRRIVDTSGG